MVCFRGPSMVSIGVPGEVKSEERVVTGMSGL